MTETVHVGTGRTGVWATVVSLDEGLSITVGGGEVSHIGGYIIVEPGKPPETFILGTHKDHIALMIIAEVVAKRYDEITILVSGGIHIDNAKKGEIQEILENCKVLADKL